MPALMKCLLLLLVLALGCSREIGDSCVVPADCDPDGERECLEPAVEGGYCTIRGCDFNTCPEEAACIRFFTGGFTNRTCDPTAADGGRSACSLDELCSIKGICVPRSAEVRFCMRTCGSDGDCRGGYECRDLALMKQHGGEPVLAPGAVVGDDSPKFCALAPAT